MPFVKGIDVSVYDPVVNWAKVREQGYRFVFVRSSYGVDNKPLKTPCSIRIGRGPKRRA